jgi:hypothetical protein
MGTLTVKRGPSLVYKSNLKEKKGKAKLQKKINYTEIKYYKEGCTT